MQGSYIKATCNIVYNVVARYDGQLMKCDGTAHNTACC